MSKDKNSCILAQEKLKLIGVEISQKQTKLTSHSNYYKNQIKEGKITDKGLDKLKELFEEIEVTKSLTSFKNQKLKEIKLGKQDVIDDLFVNTDDALMKLFVVENKKLAGSASFNKVQKELTDRIAKNPDIQHYNERIKNFNPNSDGNIYDNIETEKLVKDLEKRRKLKDEEIKETTEAFESELNKIADEVADVYIPYTLLGMDKRFDNFGRNWRIAEDLRKDGQIESSKNLKKFLYMHAKDAHGRSSNGIVQGYNIDEEFEQIQRQVDTFFQVEELKNFKNVEELYPEISNNIATKTLHGQINRQLETVVNKDLRNMYLKKQQNPNYKFSEHELKLQKEFKATLDKQAEYFAILRESEGIKNIKNPEWYRNISYDKKKISRLTERELNQMLVNGYKSQRETIIKLNKDKNVVKKKVLTDEEIQDFADLTSLEMTKANKEGSSIELNLTETLNKIKGANKEVLESEINKLQQKYGPSWSKHRMDIDYLNKTKFTIEGKEVEMSVSDLMLDNFLSHQSDNIAQRLKRKTANEKANMTYKVNGESKVLNIANEKSVDEFLSSVKSSVRNNADLVADDLRDYIDDLFIAGFTEKDMFGKKASQLNRITRQAITTASMGSVILSSFVEVGTSVASVGIYNFIQSIGETNAIFKRIENSKATVSDLHFMDEIGYSASHDYWQRKLASVHTEDEAVLLLNPQSKLDVAENVTSMTANTVVNRINFLGKYTGHMRMTSAIGYMKNLKDNIGSLSHKNSRIQELGLNEKQFNEIKTALTNTNEIMGTKILDDLEKSLSRETMDAFSNAIRRKAKNIILDISKGEGNKYLNKNPALKTLFQFHTYTSQATTKMLMNGLTHMDTEFTKGVLLSSMMGMGISYGKDFVNNRTEDNTLFDYVKKGVSVSSFAGELPFLFGSAWDLAGLNKIYKNPFIVRNRDMNIRGVGDFFKLTAVGGFSAKLSDLGHSVLSVGTEDTTYEDVLYRFFRLFPNPYQLKSGFENQIMNRD